MSENEEKSLLHVTLCAIVFTSWNCAKARIAPNTCVSSLYVIATPPLIGDDNAGKYAALFGSNLSTLKCSSFNIFSFQALGVLPALKRNLAG